MHAIREQVAEDELSEFDNKVKTLSDKALDAINTLKEVIEQSSESRSQEDELAVFLLSYQDICLVLVNIFI